MKEMPNTVRRSIEALGLCAIGLILVTGQNVIMPLLMAFFIALLLLPMFRFFRRLRVPEAISIVLSIIALFLVVAGISFFLSWQIGGFVSDIETIQKNLTIHWNNLSGWISSKTNITVAQQLDMIREQSTKLGNNVMSYLQGAAASAGNVFIFLGLLPIYIFLILFYRNLLLRFVYMWFPRPQHERVREAARETEVIVKYYLLGLLIQITYLTVLLGGILLLFGIKHAILIGITFAILNLIPYLGALIGNLIGVLLTLTTSQELYQIWLVLGTIAFVQFLDNNILMPRIVGSKVKVNALASIVGIFIGGALAGISGMFLSLPVMAVLKIMFDKSDDLKHWGVLLGDDRPEKNPMAPGVLKMRKNLEQRRDNEVDKNVDD